MDHQLRSIMGSAQSKGSPHPGVLGLRYGAWVVATAVLLSGCLCTPLLPMRSKNQCSSDDKCLTGYYCSAAGICERGQRPFEESCVAGLLYCDGVTATTCGDDGLVESAEVCEEDQVCVEGGCSSNVICTANQATCVDNTPYTCSSDGTQFGAGADCGSDFCIDGSCQAVQSICPAASTYCKDNMAYECSSDGTAILSSSDCGQQICVGGFCLDQICDPGVADCENNTARTCNATGTAYSVTTPCDVEQACLFGACRTQVCQPGSSCDGNTMVVCNPQGTVVFRRQECAPGVCTGGQCEDVDAGAGADIHAHDAGDLDVLTAADRWDAGGADGSVSCVEDAYEEHDDIGDAHTLQNGVQYNGNLCDDEDVFALLVPAGRQGVVVIHFAHSTGDLDLQLQNAQGSSLETSNGTTNTEQVTTPLRTIDTTFYAVVYGYNSAQGEYSIELVLQTAPDAALADAGTVLPDATLPEPDAAAPDTALPDVAGPDTYVAPVPCPADDALEPDDQEGAATVLELPFAESDLAMCDMADWFRFDWPANQVITIDILTDYSRTLVSLQVETEDGNFYDGLRVGSSAHSLQLPVSTTERVGLLKVYPRALHDPLTSAPYQLLVSTEPGTTECQLGQVNNGSQCVPWQVETVVTSRQFPGGTSVALDGSGHPAAAMSDQSGVNYAKRSSGGTWQTEFISSAMGSGGSVSLAFDASDSPHVAFAHYTTHEMRYAHDSGGWSVAVIDDGESGKANSMPHLIFDSQQRPNILYSRFDTGTGIFRAVLDSEWQIETIETGGNRGTTVTGAAMDSLGQLHVIYRKDINDVPLQHAYRITAGWEISEVGVDDSRSGGWLDLDNQDRAHLCYVGPYSGGERSHPGLYSFFDGKKWQTQELSQDRIAQCRLVLDSQQRPHVVYIDDFNRDLYYARMVDGSWQYSVVAFQGTMSYPALVLDGGDNPHLVFRHDDDGTINSQPSTLKYATW